MPQSTPPAAIARAAIAPAAIGRTIAETLTGFVVALAVLSAIYFAYTAIRLNPRAGYELQTRFSNAAGLAPGIDVKISGIKVGAVIDLALDARTRRPIVRFSIDPAIRLPVDSVVQIASEGLLGGSYINILPGTSSEMAPSGAEIRRSEEAVESVRLLGEIVSRAMKYTAQADPKQEEPKRPASSPR